MKACDNCGRDNVADAQFCAACGEYLGWQAPAPGPRPQALPEVPVEVPVEAPVEVPVEGTAALATAVSALVEGERLAEVHARSDVGERLAMARERLAQQVLGVAIVGEFKRGKSTLVNALLQTDICPVDADIVTAVPTLIRFGDRPAAVAHRVSADSADQQEQQDLSYQNARLSSEEVDVDRLFELVSEAADPNRRDKLQSVEVSLPHRLLRTGLCLVDTPGVGGLESAHGAVTLSALSNACGTIFVTDASQELTEPEISFLRQTLERTATAVCVVTKTDLYPQWRQIVELNRGHLAAAQIDIPVLAVSSFLRLRAWRAQELNEESGFAELFDWLRTDIVEAASTQAVTAAGRDLDFAQEQLRIAVVAEQQVLAEPAASQEVVQELRRTSERTRRLMDTDSGWQQFLVDGIEDLVADVKHDLSERMRALMAEVEEVIDQGDPKETWPAIDVWLHRQVVRTATANYDLLAQRAEELSAEVAQSFALESNVPLTLGLTAPGELSRGLVLNEAQGGAGGGQALTRMVFAGRTAILVPYLIFGVIGTNLALMAAMGPLAIALGAGIGRKLIKDERKRQLMYRRQQAKLTCRRYIDEATFVFGKDCMDSLRRTRRELRDEFQSRAAVLHASSQQALSSVERATQLHPGQREARAGELARARREIEDLSSARVPA
jgi:GTPase SAR1 family protein